MAQAQIGAILVDAMRGSPLPAAAAVETIDPAAGEDYARYRALGTRVNPVQLVTEQVIAVGATPATTLANAIRDLLELRGTSQTITDAHGRDHLNCMILDCQPAAHRVISHLGDSFRIETTWTVARGAQ